jgi:hypothetical protein
MEPDPWFFGLLNPDPSDSDPVRILDLFEENRSGSRPYFRIRSGSWSYLRKTVRIPALFEDPYKCQNPMDPEH